MFCRDKRRKVPEPQTCGFGSVLPEGVRLDNLVRRADACAQTSHRILHGDAGNRSAQQQTDETYGFFRLLRPLRDASVPVKP